MAIEIAPADEAKIRELVESGRYRDANAVMVEALRLLEEHEQREDVQASLKHGEQDSTRGDST